MKSGMVSFALFLGYYSYSSPKQSYWKWTATIRTEQCAMYVLSAGIFSRFDKNRPFSTMCFSRKYKQREQEKDDEVEEELR